MAWNGTLNIYSTAKGQQELFLGATSTVCLGSFYFLLIFKLSGTIAAPFVPGHPPVQWMVAKMGLHFMVEQLLYVLEKGELPFGGRHILQSNNTPQFSKSTRELVRVVDRMG